MKKSKHPYDSSFDEPVEQIDFSSMSREQRWSYIWGEYLST